MAIEVNEALRDAYRDGQAAQLTPQEYRLLSCLLAERGRVVDHARLGRKMGSEADDTRTTVRVYVGYLRAKLGADAILTRRGFGYYVAEAEA